MPTLIKITKRQQDILRLIYIHRFLTRAHIQQLLHHADKAATNRLLADLKHKSLLDSHFSTSFGENTKPAIYFASLGTIAYLKATDFARESVITRLYRDRTRSARYIDRRLLAADMALSLAPVQLSDMLTPSLYANPRSRFHFLAALGVEPDLIAIGGTAQHHTVTLLEIFTKVPSYSVLGKIKAYLHLYFSGDFEDNVGLEFPHLVLACGYASQLRQIRYLIKSAQAQNPELRITVLTVAQLRASGLASYV